MIKISHKKNTIYSKKLNEINFQLTQATSLIDSSEEKSSKEIRKIIKIIKDDLKNCSIQHRKSEANLKVIIAHAKGALEDRADKLNGGLKLKKEVRAVISQIARSFQPASFSAVVSSLVTKLGVSVSLLA